jgi:phosphatidylethanolamine-binding protein (PEBP) family uncharacterized protein
MVLNGAGAEARGWTTNGPLSPLGKVKSRESEYSTVRCGDDGNETLPHRLRTASKTKGINPPNQTANKHYVLWVYAQFAEHLAKVETSAAATGRVVA